MDDVATGVNVLGPVEVDGGSSLEPRDRTVLAVLAIRRGQVVSPAQIADAVWRESPPGSWPKQVQICIGRLRRVLGPTAIETTAGGYRLTLDDEDVDVRRFESLVERARVLRATGEHQRAAATFGAGLALWRGAPLEQLDGWPPAQSEAARLEELRRTAEEDWLDARLDSGDHRQVVADAEAMVSAEPLRERRWATLALAQYRCARQADALRSLSRARRLLVEELGLSPGPELAELEAAILRQDPALAIVAEPASPGGECPYKGLAAFDEDDFDSFFGRDEEIAACAERLDAHPFLVVAGPSGCGKSSLVRAGLIPVLTRQHREVLVVVPGNDPAGTASVIRTAPEWSVVVVDQFEELFELDHPADSVDDLCRTLVAHADRGGAVILAIRSDRLGELGVDAQLAQLVERGLHLLTPLGGDALRMAIEEPARLAGLRLEHGLVELLVRDCDGEPGALPLLSHALVETWRRRDGATLTVEGYYGSGGIRGAVARSADRLHDGLGSADRRTLRGVLLRLVTASTEGDPVRCRVSARSLLDDPGRARIVGQLVRARLVTADEASFEVAHEALARAWPRLRSWLDEDVAGQRILRHLTAAADDWDSLGRPDTELYRGGRLETALEWCEATTPELTELERTFLATSADHAQSERRTLQARAERDAATTRRLRRLLAVTAALVVIAVVAGVVGLRQSDRADAERHLATTRGLAAAAVASVDVDAERSGLLALAALDQAGADGGAARADIEQALHDALSEMRVERRLPESGSSVDWSSDGEHILTTGRTTAEVELRDVATGDTVRPFASLDGGATAVVDSSDGSAFAVAGRDGTLRLVEAATGEQQWMVSGEGTVTHPAFNADGSLVSAAWPTEHGGVVRVVDVSTGSVVREVAWSGATAQSLSPEGDRVAVISPFGGAVVDIASGREVASLGAPLGQLLDVAWSADGRFIAIAREVGGAQIHDAETGQQVMVVAGHRAQVTAVAFSPDSSMLATASNDGTTKIWLLFEGGGRELMALTADDTRSGMNDVSFSSDGSRVVTSTLSGTALVWRVGLDATAEVASLPGPALGPGAVVFTADGRRVLTTGGQGSVNVWRAETWQRERELGAAAVPAGPSIGDRPLTSPDDVVRLAPSPDGRLVAAISLEAILGAAGTMSVHDIDGGPSAFTMQIGQQVGDVDWSTDSELIAVAGRDRDDVATVIVADRTGEELASIPFPRQRVETARFAADGRLVVALSQAGGEVVGTGRVEVWDWRRQDRLRTLEVDSWSATPHPSEPLVAIGPSANATDQAVVIWNIDTGERVASLVGHTGLVDALAFSSSGDRIATAGGDGLIRIWDPTTGAEQLALGGHRGRVYTVAFSPDGRRLASFGADGTTRVWTLDLDELADTARSRVTRSLTDAECERYLRRSDCGPT